MLPRCWQIYFWQPNHYVLSPANVFCTLSMHKLLPVQILPKYWLSQSSLMKTYCWRSVHILKLTGWRNSQLHTSCSHTESCICCRGQHRVYIRNFCHHSTLWWPHIWNWMGSAFCFMKNCRSSTPHIGCMSCNHRHSSGKSVWLVLVQASRSSTCEGRCSFFPSNISRCIRYSMMESHMKCIRVDIPHRLYLPHHKTRSWECIWYLLSPIAFCQLLNRMISNRCCHSRRCSNHKRNSNRYESLHLDSTWPGSLLSWRNYCSESGKSWMSMRCKNWSWSKGCNLLSKTSTNSTGCCRNSHQDKCCGRCCWAGDSILRCKKSR